VEVQGYAFESCCCNFEYWILNFDFLFLITPSKFTPTLASHKKSLLCIMYLTFRYTVRTHPRNSVSDHGSRASLTPSRTNSANSQNPTTSGLSKISVPTVRCDRTTSMYTQATEAKSLAEQPKGKPGTTMATFRKTEPNGELPSQCTATAKYLHRICREKQMRRRPLAAAYSTVRRCHYITQSSPGGM